MKLRFVPVLLLYPLLAILGAQPSAAGGCGWDYPCAPDPGYGRPAYRSGQVNIHNNYGSVNVYTSRRPGPPVSIDPGFNPDFSPAPCRGEGCRYGCGGYPCTEKCGTLCWLRRFRQGYCGHGCASYMAQARIEAEEKARWQEEEAWRRHKEDWIYQRRAECARPNCAAEYDAPPPPPVRYYDDRPREERTTPRRRRRPCGITMTGGESGATLPRCRPNAASRHGRT